jgi:AcrR family transcriptional regulator
VEGGAARDRRFLATRKRILEAAKGLVETTGVEGLTMRALAAKVDYSATALYKYFKDKDELLEAINKEGWAALRAEGEPPPDGKANKLDALIAGGMKNYRFARQNPGTYLVMMGPGRDAYRDLEAFRVEPDFAGLEALISEGIRTGDIAIPPGTDAFTAALFCFIVIHGAAMLRMGVFKGIPVEWDGKMEEILAMAKTFFEPGSRG